MSETFGFSYTVLPADFFETTPTKFEKELRGLMAKVLLSINLEYGFYEGGPLATTRVFEYLKSIKLNRQSIQQIIFLTHRDIESIIWESREESHFLDLSDAMSKDFFKAASMFWRSELLKDLNNSDLATARSYLARNVRECSANTAYHAHVLDALKGLLQETESLIADARLEVENRETLNMLTGKNAGNETEIDTKDRFSRIEAYYLMHELIPGFKNLPNTVKAVFISKLTGASQESLRKKISEYGGIAGGRNEAEKKAVATLQEWKEKLSES